MRGHVAARKDYKGDLFAQIGAFLTEQGLSPDPAHYTFAYAVLTDPTGPIAQAVYRLTDGGVRLRRQDIEELGGSVVLGSSVDAAPEPADIRFIDAAEDEAIKLVAETQAQVDDFTTMMRAMRNETRDFGRDLADSAAAIGHGGRGAGLDEIARITGSMLGRIHDAEARLASATHEAEALRAKLAEANDTARRDVLTGLPNRRAFDEAFAARDDAEGPFCLAVCDIDRFKRINDAYGHPVGDRVLSAIGSTLTEECGSHLVVRHGGEEFAVLLHGVDLADAAAHLDHVRAVIAAKRFRLRETDAGLGQVTLSIGVTAVQPFETTSAAFGRADGLLYTAKSEGRDRVCAA